jgi:iron-sulfur cluster assembly protein
MVIDVTESAAEQIRNRLERGGIQGGGIRLGVKGGGCSGLNYVIRFEEAPKTGDKVFEIQGVQLFVDFKSLLYLKGTKLDWQGDFMKQGFELVNPNAKSTCSCGLSFSV